MLEQTPLSSRLLEETTVQEVGHEATGRRNCDLEADKESAAGLGVKHYSEDPWTTGPEANDGAKAGPFKWLGLWQLAGGRRWRGLAGGLLQCGFAGGWHPLEDWQVDSTVVSAAGGGVESAAGGVESAAGSGEGPTDSEWSPLQVTLVTLFFLMQSYKDINDKPHC